jgi:geranylgeranyl diphosphate synthase type 3
MVVAETVQFDDLIKPYNYLKESTCGKGFRNKILSIFNLYFQLSESKLCIVQEFIDILHNSSLLIDDVEDDGILRRGKKCAHQIYGIANTINAGNLMYFKAWEKLLELELNDLNKIYVSSMINLHIGQGKELYWRDNNKCPTEKEYLEMVIGKTGELFKLGVNVMACVGDKVDSDKITKNLKQYCEILGIIYQIKNDVDDLKYNSEDADANREEFAHDIDEGKYSFPVLYCVKSGKMKFIRNRKTHGNLKITEKLDIVKAIEEYGGINYSLDKIRELQREAENLVDEIEGFNEMKLRLKEVINSLVI